MSPIELSWTAKNIYIDKPVTGGMTWHAGIDDMKTNCLTSIPSKLIWVTKTKTKNKERGLLPQVGPGRCAGTRRMGQAEADEEDKDCSFYMESSHQSSTSLKGLYQLCWLLKRKPPVAILIGHRCRCSERNVKPKIERILLLNTSDQPILWSKKCTFITTYCVGHVKLWGNVKRSTQTKVKDKYTQEIKAKTNGVALSSPLRPEWQTKRYETEKNDQGTKTGLTGQNDHLISQTR